MLGLPLEIFMFSAKAQFNTNLMSWFRIAALLVSDSQESCPDFLSFLSSSLLSPSLLFIPGRLLYFLFGERMRERAEEERWTVERFAKVQLLYQ